RAASRTVSRRGVVMGRTLPWGPLQIDPFGLRSARSGSSSRARATTPARLSLSLDRREHVEQRGELVLLLRRVLAPEVDQLGGELPVEQEVRQQITLVARLPLGEPRDQPAGD